MIPLLSVVLAFVLMLAVLAGIIRNVNRNRQDMYNHWYAVGYRDGEEGTMWYSIQAQQKSALIVNAYYEGYNAGRKDTRVS